MNDIIWKVFWRYTIIEELPHRIYIKPNWKERKVIMVKCRCICWNENNVVYNNLLNWTSKSCWCLQKEIVTQSDNLFKKEEINIWDRFWKLTILKEVNPIKKDYRPNWYRKFLCKCDCWNEKEILLQWLKRWTSSCWCNVSELSKIRMKWNKIWEWKTHSEKTKNKFRTSNFYKKRKAVSIIMKDIRWSDKYKKWRLDVFIKSWFLCELSKQWSRWDIEAHHIKNLYKIVIENNILSLEDAYNCDEIWDINNWIVLNKYIHKEFHKMYWQYNNTLEQLEEFKKLIA